MKFRNFLTLLALVLVASLSAQTTAERAGERAKNRAENRAQNNVDRKVDKAVDDAFNAVGNLFKKNKKGKASDKVKDGGAAPNNGEEYQNEEEAMGAFGNMMGGNSGPWEPYTNPVSFSVRMEMTEEKKNGKTEDMAMEMAVTETEWGVRMEDADAQEQNRMILNTQDGKTTMITTDKNGQRSGMRMRMPGMRAATVDATNDYLEGITIEGPGETRVIDGYSCRKYVVTDTKHNTTTETWVTTDAGINAQEIFAGMINAFGGPKAAAKAKGGPTAAMQGGYEGFPILSISNDGKSTYTMRFRNLKVGEAQMDKSLLDTNGIQIQSIGF